MTMFKPFDPTSCFTIVLAGLIVAVVCHQSHKHHHKFRFWIEYIRLVHKLRQLERNGAIECPRHPHLMTTTSIPLKQTDPYIHKFLGRSLKKRECAATKLARAVYQESKTIVTKGRCAAACSSDLVHTNNRRRIADPNKLRESIIDGLRSDDGVNEECSSLRGMMPSAMRAVVDHSHTTALAGSK